MFYEKRYLQFNNLVFDGYDMLSDYDESVSFKGNDTAYSYGHGSYFPLKADYMFLDPRSVSMTLTIKTKKVPCEYREYYVRFAEQELYRPGRLWAIKNNEILWAWAIPRNIRAINSMKQHEVVWNVEFTIPSGVWHKADKLKTFVLPYDVCTFMDCKGYKTIDPCEQKKTSGDCCLDCLDNNAIRDANYDERCFCCCVEQICNYHALCFNTDKLQGFYSCDTPFQLVYDCNKAELYNDGEPLGQKLCTKDTCSNIIAGRLYSETDIPTRDMKIEIVGSMSNPTININGNVNVIKGDYEHLLINADGSVYALTECCETLVSADKWSIPKGMDYGWTIYPQENSVIIDTHDCCGRKCAYISADNITA